MESEYANVRQCSSLLPQLCLQRADRGAVLQRCSTALHAACSLNWHTDTVRHYTAHAVATTRTGPPRSVCIASVTS